MTFLHVIVTLKNDNYLTLKEQKKDLMSTTYHMRITLKLLILNKAYPGLGVGCTPSLLQLFILQKGCVPYSWFLLQVLNAVS